MRPLHTQRQALETGFPLLCANASDVGLPPRALVEHVEQIGRVVRQNSRRQRSQVENEHEYGDPYAGEGRTHPQVAFATVERRLHVGRKNTPAPKVSLAAWKT
jgi:hypothetical protein